MFFWPAAMKKDILLMIQFKFGCIWPSCFREEYFESELTTDGQTDDGRQTQIDGKS